MNTHILPGRICSKQGDKVANTRQKDDRQMAWIPALYLFHNTFLMEKRLSVIIPNYNGGKTIGKCLGAAFASTFTDYEIVVVDDCSDDDSVGIIGQFPCRLIKLDRRSGSAKARNEGARHSSSKILFFIDADCLLQPNTLATVDQTITGNEENVFGGTYTPLPFDQDFFSTFQSIFINYSETKKKEPDYIAGHAMVISRELFLKHDGFPEIFLPIIEDVEFSHRLRRAGIVLQMNPAIQVTHIFNFTLVKSLQNAFRKSHFWTIYSLQNRDLTMDSGTSSFELKGNVLSWFVTVLSGVLFGLTGNIGYILPMGLITFVNLAGNRRFFAVMHRVKGTAFTCLAALYYTMLYPLPVAAGGLSGLVRYTIACRNGGH